MSPGYDPLLHPRARLAVLLCPPVPHPLLGTPPMSPHVFHHAGLGHVPVPGPLVMGPPVMSPPGLCCPRLRHVPHHVSVP